MTSKVRKRLEMWDDIIPFPSLSRKCSIVLIAFLSAVCYIVSIDGDFVFDDTEAVVHNKDVTLLNPISGIFFNDFWGTRMTHNQSHKSYRPITVLSFRFNVWLNGGVLSSHQFRLINILLHSVVCMSSLKVFELLLGGNCHKAATLCAVVFSVHPVHTEAVAGVVGRAELLSALFSFLTLILYNQAAQTVKVSNNLFYSLLSIILVSFAMLSKEQGITMLGICLVYDVLVVNRMYLNCFINIFYDNLRMLIKNIKLISNCDEGGSVIEPKNNYANVNRKINRENIITVYMILLRFILLLIGGLLLLYMRWKIMSGIPPTFQKVDNLASFVDNIVFRVINYNYIYAINCWLLLCPIWLCFDWSMGCIPLIENFSDTRLVFVIAFWTILSPLLFYPLFIGCDNKTNRCIIMAVSFMIISFLPASNLFFRVGFVIAERVLYLPSVGYCILLIVGVRQLSMLINNLSVRYQSVYTWVIGAMFWFFVIGLYSGRSILRSYEWKNEYLLFKSALPVCPLNAKVQYNMGKVTQNKTLSLYYYKQAIRLNPEYDQAMNNLANLLKDDGDLDEAEELLKRSIKLRPTFAAAWMNLGIVLSNKKEFRGAEDAFLKAIKHRPHYPDCYYNLGNLYLDQKHYNKAEASWRKAVSQKPTHSIAWNNLIIMLDSLGRYEESESAAMEALHSLPTDAGIHFNLANTLGKLTRYVEAEKNFKIAIELNSEQALYYVNLGVLYHRWKKHENAKEMYRRALLINPELESARRNLKMLQ